MVGWSCRTDDTADIAKIILGKEETILDEWGKGRTMVFPENSADEITYFDPSLQKRLNGKVEFTALLKPIEYKFSIVKYTMIDPNVQVYGDIAILTYNLIDYATNAEGVEQKSNWNVTEVYHRAKGDWCIVHSHWSFTKPEIRR
jgi:ketosteroid isomerase-like protein